MRAPKRLLLQLRSNLSAFDVLVYDETQRLCFPLHTSTACVRVCTYAKRVHIVARPRVSGYTATLYFHLDTACNDRFSLSLFFPVDDASQGGINTFTLTDRNYNLPIDGTLFFQAQ